MIFDLFDSPELLDIQRTGFYHFLKEGISQLLSKEFPIKIKNGNYSIELCLNEKNVKLVAPEDNPRDCILKMKTYNCKLYAQVKIICKKSSASVNSSNDAHSKIVYQSLPEWVVIGQLPMMTKRGHFIINGSPRVIVHQVVRAPGIYFQKLIKKDDQNRARFYGDIIPLKGVWVRLQMTKKGRVEAKFKKGKKVEIEALQKCLQVIENQTLFKSIQKLPLKSFPFKYGVKKNPITFAGSNLLPGLSNTQNGASLSNEGASFLLAKKKSRSESKAEHDAFVHTYDKLYRTAQDKELEEWQKKKKNQIFFKGTACPCSKKIYRTVGEKLGGVGSEYIVNANRLQKREAFCKNKSEVKGNLHLPFESSFPLTPREKKKEPLNNFISSNAFKRKKCSENLFATFKIQSRYDLGLLGREKIKSKFGSAAYKSWPFISNSKSYASSSELHGLADLTFQGFTCLARNPWFCYAKLRKDTFLRLSANKFSHKAPYTKLRFVRPYGCTLKSQKVLSTEKERAPLLNYFQDEYNTQLTSSDLWNATLWLYKLRKGEESIDDIDHSQNRRVRTSGELLQSSFENGVYRLKNLLSTKLQEWRSSLSSSSFSSIFKSSYKARYNPKLLSKVFAGYTYIRRSPLHGVDFCSSKKAKALIFKSKKRKTSIFRSFNKRSLLGTRNARSSFIYKEGSYLQEKKKLRKTGNLFTSAVDGKNTLRRGSEGARTNQREARTWCLCTCKGMGKNKGMRSFVSACRSKASCTENVKRLNKCIGMQSEESGALVTFGVARRKIRTCSLRICKKTQAKCKKKQSSHRLLQPQKHESYYLLPAPKIKELFSTKPITGALREFFGSNPLSQYMDQTNPLAEITHKRRISSLGLGGVSRESAGMAIRGIHPTHYGRICPIETPEGKNAGLVNSLAFYTKVDKNGFLKTPYYRVFKGQVQSALGFSFWRAKEESVTGLQIAPSDLQKSSNNILRTRFSTVESVPVRVAEPSLDVFKKENPYKVQAIAISPIQMISVATSLIPFLEHNDANRALMGSNMQRQAVPLMISERPIVGTGLESTVILESGHITESQISGFVSHVSANKIIIDRLLYKKKAQAVKEGLRKNLLANKSTYKSTYKSTICTCTCTACKKCMGGVGMGQGIPSKASYALALALAQRACAWSPSPSLLTCTSLREVQVRREVLVRRKVLISRFVYKPYTCFAKGESMYMSKGDAKPLTNQREVVASLRRSVHKVQIKKKGQASFFISTISPFTTFSRSNQNTCITEKPLVREFDWVQKGDPLTDCSASHNGELAVGKNVLLAYIPWEGYNFEDAIVISDRLVREHVYTSLHIERYVFQAQDLKEGAEWFTKHLPGVDSFSIQHLEESGLPKIGSFLKEGDIIVGKIRYLNKKPSSPYERLLCDILGEKNFAARNKSLYVPKGVEARVIYHKVISFFDTDPENKVRPLGSAKIVHLFLGERRVIQVGDKISGRHGNKGVISTILPRQDMPYLPDGTPIDLILNPLGVPSRMNVGQVLECLLGLAATYLNTHFKISAFDERYGVEASKSIVFLKLYQARLMSGQNWLFQVSFPGKTRLVDGRSGECFDQWITVGKAYILKLIHMVSEKIHARSTGPYALITQQPLRGRSNKGGQRLGEMEVWALEGFGAAYTLQELLTKKSDDFFGRKQIVDSILPSPASVIDTLKPSDRISKNKNVLGHPEIFKVLLCELQALCLDLGVYIVTPESFQRTFLGVVH